MNQHHSPPRPSIAQRCFGASRRFAAVVLSMALAFAAWPVDTLEVRIQPEDALVWRALMPLGDGVWTGYVHSLQRTPVWDYYTVAQGRLWTWREYVQSHNAGLPYAAPPQGRFELRAPWMLIEGGRLALPELYVRVGTAALGRNVLAWPQAGGVHVAPLYTQVPKKRLRFVVTRQPLWDYCRTNDYFDKNVKLYFPFTRRVI